MALGAATSLHMRLGCERWSSPGRIRSTNPKAVPSRVIASRMSGWVSAPWRPWVAVLGVRVCLVEPLYGRGDVHVLTRDHLPAVPSDVTGLTGDANGCQYLVTV